VSPDWVLPCQMGCLGWLDLLDPPNWAVYWAVNAYLGLMPMLLGISDRPRPAVQLLQQLGDADP
jgi:hypothetical protein